MSAIGKNLYPPIVPTYQTPFVYTDRCRIYFSLPTYNNPEDFSREIQVTISTQNGNRSALNKSKYPIGILCVDYQIDREIKGDNKYFISLFNSDIEGGFSPDIYYKVQIRLAKAGTRSRASWVSTTPGAPMQRWINQNLDNFSEWSTITLVKSIHEPRFILNPFSPEDKTKNIIFSTGFQTLSGTLDWYSKEEQKTISSEYLKSYRIFITKKETDEDGKETDITYVDSGEQFPINKNEVFYNIEKKLDDKSKYSLSIELYTNNGYTLKEKGYNFTIYKLIESPTDANIKVSSDCENGRARIKVTLSSQRIVNNFVIKRASSKNNFAIWKDIHFCSLGENSEYEWYDYTLESGVLYQYAIQRIDIFNNIRNREKIATDENNNSTIIMLPLEDIFLTTAKMQFKVKFDPNISSFKTNYLESKSDTLGSKFPFIRRNGNVKYRTFPISGLITAFCDEEGLFLNKNNLYNEEERLYYDGQGVGYNSINRITAHKDFVYEKAFREKIIDFLQEDSIKLFRSATEGNILIKIMDINFTPNQSLGRMLYSFSATAVEVADCTIENYDKYGIQYLQKESLSEEDGVISYKIGQLNEIKGNRFNWKTNIVNYLHKHYSKNLLKTEGETNILIETSVSNLKWIRITFNSEPKLIDAHNSPGEYRNPNTNVIKASSSTPVPTRLGYLLKINNKSIIVNKNGVYELKGDNIDISQLSVQEGDLFTLDYVVELRRREQNVDKPTFSQRILSESIGQIHDKFNIEEKFIDKISSKYNIIHPKFTQTFTLLNDITIEADSGSILYIIQKNEDGEVFTTRHEIGKTNILKFKDEYEKDIFKNFYFYGRHLYKKEYDYENNPILFKVSSGKGSTKIIPCQQYEDIKNTYPYIIKILNQYGEIYIAEDEYLDLTSINVNYNNVKIHTNNCLFKNEEGKKIYYQNKWYDFDDEETVLCPIDALVDYTYTLIKEEYEND